MPEMTEPDVLIVGAGRSGSRLRSIWRGEDRGYGGGDAGAPRSGAEMQPCRRRTWKFFGGLASERYATPVACGLSARHRLSHTFTAGAGANSDPCRRDRFTRRMGRIATADPEPRIASTDISRAILFEHAAPSHGSASSPTSVEDVVWRYVRTCDLARSRHGAVSV